MPCPPTCAALWCRRHAPLRLGRDLRRQTSRLAPGLLLAALALGGCSAPLGEAEVYGSLAVDRCEGGRPARWTCGDGAPDPGTPDPVTPDGGAADGGVTDAAAPSACRAFTVDADHLSLETFGSRAVVRLQAGGRPLAIADAVAFDVREAATVRAQLGEPIALADDGPVRGVLAVFARCPDATDSFRLDGAVVFEAFGAGIGDRVAGRFDQLQVRDRRDPTRPPLGFISGRFDFEVVKGTIHQRFIDL